MKQLCVGYARHGGFRLCASVRCQDTIGDAGVPICREAHTKVMENLPEFGQSSAALQGSIEVLEDVVRRFEADRQPYESVADSGRRAILR